MSQTVTDGCWTTTDIDLLADNEGTQVVDGELFMTRAPHWRHQRTCGRIFKNLILGQTSGLGEACITPGVLFTESDNVMPDVVWLATND